MSVGLIATGLPSGITGWKLLQGKTPADFKAFSKDAGLQRDITYLREKLPTKLTAKELLADRRLQGMVLKAYGLDGQLGFNALMQKVLESNPDDTTSTAGRMTDYRYRQIARDLNYGGTAIPEIPAVPSSLSVQVEGVRTGQGFLTISGSFAGLTVEDVDVSGLDSREQIAARLQKSFRAADGDREDIKVELAGLRIVLTDAKGRGTGSLSFAADPETTARAYLLSSTKGSTAVKASGGPKVGEAKTVESIVAKYTQARFEESLGETSESLRQAVYAKRMLPQVSSWYSIIADRNLASVIQGYLGLPDSFGKMNVDQQKAQLEKRMKIEDLKDSTKLAKILDVFVAKSSITEAKSLASANGAVSLLQPLRTGSTSINSLTSSAILKMFSA